MKSAGALRLGGVAALAWEPADTTTTTEALAFEAVYWPLFVRAFRLAYRIVGNKPEAEDVAAEALARAHLHWSKIGPLPHRDAWVLRVASNLARSTVRRRRRAPEPAPVAALDDSVVLRAAVEAAVSSLPRRQRETIALRYLAGLDLDEIASCLGISAETVRIHIRRGLGALRTKLTQEDDRAVD